MKSPLPESDLTGTFDSYVREIVSQNPNAMVSWYLIASYAYYERNESLLSDHYFDYLCKDLLEQIEDIEHVNKNLLDMSALEAGTGFGIRYPLRVQHIGESFIRRLLGQ